MSKFTLDLLNQSNIVLDAATLSKISPFCNVPDAGAGTDSSASDDHLRQNPDEINPSSLLPMAYVMPNPPLHNVYYNATGSTADSDQSSAASVVLNQNASNPTSANVYYNAPAPTVHIDPNSVTPTILDQTALTQGTPPQYFGPAGPVVSPISDFRQYYNWPFLCYNANNFYYNLWPPTFQNPNVYISSMAPEVPSVPPSYDETVGGGEVNEDGTEHSTPQSSGVQDNTAEVNSPGTTRDNFFNQSFLFPSAISSTPESSESSNLQTIKFLAPTSPADRSKLVTRRSQKQISYAAAIQGFKLQELQPIQVSDPNQSYTCLWEDCGEIIYGSRPEVNHHLKTKHFGFEWTEKKTLVRCLWPLCSTKAPIQLGNLAKHLTDKHLLSTLHQCALCMAPVSRPENIDRHLSRYCTKVKERLTQGVLPEASSP